MKQVFIALINFYQKNISFFRKKGVCVFYPSCSTYAKQALEKYDVFGALFLISKRILRCHPWQKNQIDLLK